MLTSAWSEDGGPRRSAREELLVVADEMRSGRFGSAARLLAAPGPLSTVERAAAQRFFARAPESRQRFVAVVSAVERRTGDEGAARGLRFGLQRALKAAAAGDAAAVDVQLRLAETELKDLDFPSGGFGAGPEALLARIQRLGPALSLGRDLLTEGYAAVEKLVARASWHFKANQHREAARLLDLAAQLIGEEGPAPTSAPAWFLKMAQAPVAAVDKGRAEAALKLCEAVTATESPGGVVGRLVERARTELDAGRAAESYWWATVAMSALGMTEEAVAAAVVPAEGPRQ
jgi:hypothetical protein